MEKGLKFGRRTTLGECIKKGCDRLEKCVCECGTEKFVRRTHLRRGNSLSCGCYRIEANKEKLIQTHITHGMYGTKFYKTYMGIRQRCNNPNATGYQLYGGRGIKCLRNTFEEFYDDMYDSFLEHIEKYGKDTSIDRIDVNGNYCKENCRRATNDIQQSNRRCCISVEYNGQVFPSIDSFAKYIGKSSRVVRMRLERGRSLEEIDEVPLGMNRHQYYGDSKYLPDGHKIVYKGVEYKSRRDMCKILGIKYQTLNSRIKRGHGLEDSIEYLLNKKIKMTNIKLIRTNDCVKCHAILPKLEEVASKLGASLEIINAEDYKGEHLSEIVSVPTMIVEQELVDDTLYDYEGITNFIINNL